MKRILVVVLFFLSIVSLFSQEARIVGVEPMVSDSSIWSIISLGNYASKSDLTGISLKGGDLPFKDDYADGGARLQSIYFYEEDVVIPVDTSFGVNRLTAADVEGDIFFGVRAQGDEWKAIGYLWNGEYFAEVTKLPLYSKGVVVEVLDLGYEPLILVDYGNSMLNAMAYSSKTDDYYWSPMSLFPILQRIISSDKGTLTKDVGEGFVSVYYPSHRRNYLIKPSRDEYPDIVLPCESNYFSSTIIDTVLNINGTVHIGGYKYNAKDSVLGIQVQIHTLGSDGLVQVVSLDNVSWYQIKNLILLGKEIIELSDGKTFLQYSLLEDLWHDLNNLYSRD